MSNRFSRNETLSSIGSTIMHGPLSPRAKTGLEDGIMGHSISVQDMLSTKNLDNHQRKIGMFSITKYGLLEYILTCSVELFVVYRSQFF